jgi:hypothetical protein
MASCSLSVRDVRYFKVSASSPMEQSCYKCRQIVEEGIAFCPHCSAPQIRVVVAEPVSPSPVYATAAMESSVSFSGSSTGSSASSRLSASETVPVLAVPMQWSQGLGPCALAALVATILMALGLNPFVAMLCVGFLAVVFYRQRHPEWRVKAGTGARLGALSGIFCFGFTSILIALASTSSDFRTKIREQFIDNAQKWAASRPADAQIQAALDQLKTPEGLVMALIVGSIFLFVICILLASVGGALGGTIFGRRNQP